MTKYFITGIGTGIGKTFVSAVLVEKLKAAYWKPIQSGLLEYTDSHFIKEHTNVSQIFEESYRFKEPLSPHAAAKLDGVEIEISTIKLPQTNGSLVVEGCGGLLVPLNKSSLVIDLIAHIGLPVIIVSKHYLGSINHTLLTVESLKARNISIKGIIFNGPDNFDCKEIILHYTGLTCLGELPELHTLSKDSISALADTIKL